MSSSTVVSNVTSPSYVNEANAGNPSTSSATKKSNPPHNNVSECLFEYLLSEILHWIEAESTQSETKSSDKSDQAILSAERAAAKIERLGFGVGYRLCERLTQTKPLSTTHSQPSYLTSTSSEAVNTAGNSNTNATAMNKSAASHHLEAVKFLCKEFWMSLFRKQVDKLQTNHRGIFVLKDNELKWLKRFPSEDERARVAAIKMLAFPCGLIRGALSNLGIAAVVSCDFLADGKTMSACSFNIKIKT